MSRKPCKPCTCILLSSDLSTSGMVQSTEVTGPWLGLQPHRFQTVAPQNSYSTSLSLSFLTCQVESCHLWGSRLRCRGHMSGGGRDQPGGNKVSSLPLVVCQPLYIQDLCCHLCWLPL